MTREVSAIKILSRRALLRGSAWFTVALAGGFLRPGALQAAGELPQLAENDPQAAALKYRNDATQSQRKDDKQFCHTCRYFKGKKGDPWGPCDLYPGKQVNANGWCSVWAVKS